jgi:hypothetical protein
MLNQEILFRDVIIFLKMITDEKIDDFQKAWINKKMNEMTQV